MFLLKAVKYRCCLMIGQILEKPMDSFIYVTNKDSLVNKTLFFIKLKKKKSQVTLAKNPKTVYCAWIFHPYIYQSIYPYPFPAAYLGSSYRNNCLSREVQILSPSNRFLQLSLGDRDIISVPQAELLWNLSVVCAWNTILRKRQGGNLVRCPNLLNWLLVVWRSSSSTTEPVLNDWAPHLYLRRAQLLFGET